jgi:hypothetical protein
MAPALIPLIGFAILIGGMAAFGMHFTAPYWLSSWINAMLHPHGNIFTRVALYPVTKLAQGAAWLYNQVAHALSVAASHSLWHVGTWLNGHATRETHVQKTNADFNTAVAEAFEHGFGVAVPRKIEAKTRPLHRGIDHNANDLRKLRARLAKLALGIDTLLGAHLLLRTKHVEHATDVTIPRSIGGVRQRVKVLERELSNPARRFVVRVWRRGWILVGAGLMVKFLAKKFPYLFCRGTTDFLRGRPGQYPGICGIDPGLLAALLTGAIAINEVNLRDFCRALQAIEGEIVGEIQGFVTLGD